MRSLLVLTLVLHLGALDGNVGHSIPGIMNADEQKQNRCRSDAEQGRYRIAWEHNCRDDDDYVRDEWKYDMPQPIFQYRLIVDLMAHPPCHDDDVHHSPEPAEAQQQARL